MDLRILRAFAWLRWHMLINSLEHTGARDRLERFSIAIEKLGPILLAVLLIPNGIGLSVLAAAGGYGLAQEEHRSLLFEIGRYALIAVPILSVIGPLLMPAADRTNPVRLLLLPISRGTLYLAQSASAFGDLWVLFMLPLVLFIPLGLAAGGAFGAALVALLAGVLLVLVIVGISSLSTSLLHLLVRDRRRGELFALVFILLIPLASMLPSLLQGERGQRDKTGRHVVRGRLQAPAWVNAAAGRAFAVYPTELYAGATRAAARREVTPAARRLLALGASALVLHTFGMFAFARVLDSPGSTGARRNVPMRAAWGLTLPGLSPGASAVALAQLRLALRTSRGRSTMISPLMVLLIMGVFLRRNLQGMQIGFFSLQGGLGLAAFAMVMCLLSILPLAMNQFAIDKAGLTRALLSPLTDREYLAGKAVGNALIIAAPALFCLIAAAAAFPGGSPFLWLSLPLGLASTYVLVAPIAAILSAIFPRVVDMNSIGRSGNAHGAAGVLGLLSFVAASAPSVLIVIASRWLARPSLVPLLFVLWCALACGISFLLFIPARRVFASRRENLSMLL